MTIRLWLRVLESRVWFGHLYEILLSLGAQIIRLPSLILWTRTCAEVHLSDPTTSALCSFDENRFLEVAFCFLVCSFWFFLNGVPTSWLARLSRACEFCNASDRLKCFRSRSCCLLLWLFLIYTCVLLMRSGEASFWAACRSCWSEGRCHGFCSLTTSKELYA